MNAPFDVKFNAMVMTMANKVCPKGWDVTDSEDEAPATWASIARRIKECGKPLVWAGASDDTVYGCPEHNWAFRAWHDVVHYQHQHDLTLIGEFYVASLQVEQMLDQYGVTEQSIKWAAYLLCEINGQANYLERTGRFPEKQREFFELNWPLYMEQAQALASSYVDNHKRAA